MVFTSTEAQRAHGWRKLGDASEWIPGLAGFGSTGIANWGCISSREEVW